MSAPGADVPALHDAMKAARADLIRAARHVAAADTYAGQRAALAALRDALAEYDAARDEYEAAWPRAKPHPED